MGHDWVIHVLSDLRQFAEQNELPLLTEQLEEAMTTAEAEIAARHGGKIHFPTSAIQTEGDPLND